MSPKGMSDEDRDALLDSWDAELYATAKPMPKFIVVRRRGEVTERVRFILSDTNKENLEAVARSGNELTNDGWTYTCEQVQEGET